MYQNLKKELGANRLSMRAAAAAIGMAEATFRNKMLRGNFTVTEAFAIKERLLPKYDIEYLFVEDGADVNDEEETKED